MQGLFRCVGRKARMRCPAHAPASDATGTSTGDKASPGADAGEVRKPEPVRGWGMEDAVDMVARTGRGPVMHRGAYPLAASGAVQAGAGHQPPDGAARNREAFARQPPPDLARAADPEVPDEHSLDFRPERQIPRRLRRQPSGVMRDWRHERARLTGRSAAPCRAAMQAIVTVSWFRRTTVRAAKHQKIE